jgi:hypothetical protein
MRSWQLTRCQSDPASLELHSRVELRLPCFGMPASSAAMRRESIPMNGLDVGCKKNHDSAATRNNLPRVQIFNDWTIFGRNFTPQGEMPC